MPFEVLGYLNEAGKFGEPQPSRMGNAFDGGFARHLAQHEKKANKVKAPPGPEL